MKTIKVNIKVLVGQKCIVQNYRSKYKEWENGTCTRVEAGFYQDGRYSVSYHVMLDRKTTGRSRMYPDGGAPMFLTVGDNAIELAK